MSAGPQEARAIVVPRTVGSASPAPEPSRSTTDLPLNSSIFFVLDGDISSRGQEGTFVRAHLRDPIILGGMTVAAAGAPVQIRILHTSGAQMANVDGSVDIYFEPFTLANGQSLPLVTPSSHIDPSLTAGQASTRNVTDTVGDIFIPYHFLYHMLRKGMEVDLRPGTVMRARIAAELRSVAGAVAIVTPQPIAGAADTPRPPFRPASVATPPGFTPPTPKPSPSVLPTAQPT
ncbi:MAG TPA: hypothetical protein VFO29_01935 [Candidatus Rubrimentiphilum sp.]|nr:hypothetical protein [Candidatus Rubrimentiphilum sp.]